MRSGAAVISRRHAAVHHSTDQPVNSTDRRSRVTLPAMGEDIQRGITRRQALGLGAAAAGVAAGGALLGTESAAAEVPTDDFPLAPQGSTLEKTLVRGTPGTLGYRKVVDGPGEPSLVRSDLLGGRTRQPGVRTPVVAFGQFTDMHLVDAQSPARVEFIDRLGGAVTAAYRAQEMLSLHVAEAMVQAMNRFGSGAPVTGRPVDFLVSTGDNADNVQLNEVRWHIDLLDGRQVRPDSGSYAKWEGVGGPDDKSTYYWHPDGTPRFGKPDDPHTKYGFPTVPGLLDRCRAPFAASGLAMPWYTTFGNHDGLVQGNVPSANLFDAVAMGVLKVTDFPLGADAAALVAGFVNGDPAALTALLTLGPAKLVTRDPRRNQLLHKQVVAEYFNTTTLVGHGYTQDNLDNNTAYYSFDNAGVHFISLDTCDTYGYSEGSIDQKQLAWLTNELKANSSRYLDATGNWVTGNGPDKLIVIFSHHTVETMTNPIGINRVTGDTVAALLLQFPNVVLWVNGHTHRNTVVPYSRPAGAATGGGFWEVNTAAHIDWPEQARVVEVVDNGDGTLSVFGTIVDHAAPNDWPSTPSTPLELAALSRELGANDWQNETPTATEDGKRGKLTDRNVELLVAKPF
jgi:metallophosphoesterase (TIGR03767 family)